MKSLLLLLLVLQCSTLAYGQEHQDITLTFNHMALSVNDLDVSVSFYTDVLQLETIPVPPEMMGISWLSLGDGKELHLVSVIKEEVRTNKAVHLALSTSNFDGFIQRLSDMNITYSDFPGNVNTVSLRPDGIKQIYFQDPDGYWIEVNSVSSPNK